MINSLEMDSNELTTCTSDDNQIKIHRLKLLESKKSKAYLSANHKVSEYIKHKKIEASRFE